MTEKTVLKQISNLAFDIQHTDDLQVAFEKASEILKLTESDHQPTFAVGEYYSFTTYRKDYDADTTLIFKTLETKETKNSGIRVIEYDFHGKELGEYVYDIDSDFLKESKPATAEQIATFKRAEHFASKGRKLDEFRVGDTVDICGDEVKVTEVNVWGMNVISIDINGINRHVEAGAFDLIQTAE